MKTIDAGRVVGRSAYEDAVLQGYQGSLDEWIASLQGSDGKSAYQSWLDAGHVGTEEQFLAALKGETGTTGATGPKGDTGTTFTPSIDADGNVSWTNDGGKVNPATVNVKGAQGVAGPQGAAGNDGVSPTVSISKTGTVTTVTITDKDGVHTATINDGSQGATGPQGDTGTTFTPSIDAEGNVSWTNDGGKANPATVNVKGATGATGPQGAAGNDGVSPTVSISKTGTVTTVTITDKDGAHTATINDGSQGATGATGNDGVSPTVNVSKTDGVTTITITDKDGTHTATINDGAKGEQGEPGTTPTSMSAENVTTDDGISEGKNVQSDLSQINASLGNIQGVYMSPSIVTFSNQDEVEISISSTDGLLDKADLGNSGENEIWLDGCKVPYSGDELTVKIGNVYFNYYSDNGKLTFCAYSDADGQVPVAYSGTHSMTKIVYKDKGVTYFPQTTLKNIQVMCDEIALSMIIAEDDETEIADLDAAYLTRLTNVENNKQDKLIAGANIIIAADGKTISASGGGGSSVNVVDNLESDSTTDALSAKQGKFLNSAIAAKQSPATTLSGYGITDAKIANGIITLGTNTITPITDISGKVDKDGSKVLSTNDYTTADKTKLDGIESGAQKNAANTVVDANYNKVVGITTAALDGDDADTIEGGKRYTINLTADTPSLSINTINDSEYESIIYLTIDSDAEEAEVSLPTTYKAIGDIPSFEAGKQYVISILKSIIVCGEISETDTSAE